ncbi:MAG: hypothetical protein LBH60_04070 [Prevotellaceae bacterium]|jgi:hypothetical protein|nr:hypothetical protein [Prevotellaceae bacterium]
MKLVNNFKELDRLIEKMGAQSHLGKFSPPPWEEIITTPEELEANKKGRIEISGKLALAYVKKQRAGTEYKFHIALCSTLTAAANVRDRSKYGVSPREKFRITRVYSNGRIEEMDVRLKICRHCLQTLNYQGYNNATNRGKDAIYRNFKLDES